MELANLQHANSLFGGNHRMKATFCDVGGDPNKPKPGTHAELDHVLLPRTWRSCVKSCAATHSIHVESAHTPLRCILAIPMESHSKPLKVPKKDLTALVNKKTQKDMCEYLVTQVCADPDGETEETKKDASSAMALWTSSMIDAMDQFLENKSKDDNKPFLSQEAIDTLKKRDTLGRRHPEFQK